MRFSLTPVKVAVDGGEDGRLVFLNDRLVAVLTRLDENYGSEAGRWFFEAGFGRLDGPNHPTFPDLDAAQKWIRQRASGLDEGPPSRAR